MSAMKYNPSRHSSNSLSSQASLTSQPSGQHGAKGKARRSREQSPPLALSDSSPTAQQASCSLAIPITSTFSKPANKQGFRFSLRRMLYNSPLIGQRRARSLSGNGLNNPAPSCSNSTGGLKKKTSPSACKIPIQLPDSTF